MGFTIAGRTVSRVAVVGSGNIGPDVALFFAKSLTRHGVPVLLHDTSQEALDAGRKRIAAKLTRFHASGGFRPVEAEAMYEKASRLDPECFEAHFNLGNIHHDLGRYREALVA